MWALKRGECNTEVGYLKWVVAHPSMCRRHKRRPTVGLFYWGAGTQTCEGGCWWEDKACCLGSIPLCPPGKRWGAACIAHSPSWAGIAAVYPHATSDEEPSSLKSFTCWTKRKCTSWQTVVGMLCNRDMDLDGWTLYGMVKRFFSLQKQRNDRSSHDTQPHPLVICVFPPRWLRRERLLLVSKWQTKERGEKSGKAMPKSKERLDRKIFP